LLGFGCTMVAMNPNISSLPMRITIRMRFVTFFYFSDEKKSSLESEQNYYS
jgi:hypothetical protein